MIALVWRHASSNLGDEAVTRGCLELLRHATDDEVVVLDRGAPIPEAAVIAYGGGEHLHSGPWLKSYAHPLLHAERAVILPSTFGPFAEKDEPVVREFGRHPLAARDPVSALTMGRLLGRDIPTFADPSILMRTPRARTGKVRVLAPRREDTGIRLGRMSTRAPVADTAAWAAYLPRCGDDAVLVAHSRYDVPLCRGLSEATGTPWVRPESLDELLDVYRDAKSVVTSRFHGAIFAAIFGKEVEVLGWPAHGHKFSGIPRDITAARRDIRAWARQVFA